MKSDSDAAVVGAGTMGHGIAQVLAVHGRTVELVDRTSSRAQAAKELIAANLDVAVAEGFVETDAVEPSLERIHPTDDLEAALAGVQVVIEAVAEDVALKLEIWRSIDTHANEGVILASNTSSIDINEIAAALSRGDDRLIGTHWYNPPQIIPCVEVIPARTTSPQTTEATVSLLRELGKEPVVTKSVPGFIGNRIQLVMAAEAYRCLEEGLATADEIDRIVRSSFGFRLGAYGPLRVADLAGLDTYLGVYDYLTERCGDPWYRAPELLRGLVEQGRIGVKALAGAYDYTEEEADRLRAERDRVLYRQLRTYLADAGGGFTQASS